MTHIEKMAKFDQLSNARELAAHFIVGAVGVCLRLNDFSDCLTLRSGMAEYEKADAELQAFVESPEWKAAA